MAIDRLYKTTVFLPANDSRWFLSRLYDLGIFHITDTFIPTDDSHSPHFQRYTTVVVEIEKNIHKLNATLSILKTFVQRKKGFVDGIFPVPLQITREELDRELSCLNVETLHKECLERFERYSILQKRQEQLRDEISLLTVFLPLSDELTRIGDVLNVSFFYCRTPHSRWERFLKDVSSGDILAWQTVSQVKREMNILFAHLNSDKDVARRIFTKYDFKELPFPAVSGSVKDHAQKLVSEMDCVIREHDAIHRRFLELAGDWRPLEIVLGYWENERSKMAAQDRCAVSKRIFAIVGYVKTKDRTRLDSMLCEGFPQASVFFEDPSPSDKTPVSITLNRFFQPARLFIDMFGLPNYFTFDPTPFVLVSFLIFFGLCFGDVFYGLFLTAFSAWMIQKYRRSESLSNFMKLFLYAGVSTMVFGALTGGWAGDLYNPAYLGENNLLLRIKERITLLDVLSKPVVALVAAICLGILNQFYGIALRMYGELRRKNVVNALCDGLLWLIMLPGFLILLSDVFIKVPEDVYRVGKYMAILGAIGLVCTQGRNEKGIAAKIFTGIVSLYGIVGTYGCSSFIGDILSYTRILALSLTTTIIGMAFNIVAVLFKTGTALGTVLFVIALISGHLFNFTMSILGAFIHPARLIFLEFFGRFYEGGAPRFQPYGFGNQRIILIEKRG